MVELKFLGTSEVIVNGRLVTAGLRKKEIALLAFLAVGKEAVQRESAVTLLWGDLGEDEAKHNLRVALNKIDTSMPGAIVKHGRRLIALAEPVLRHSDVWQFEQAVQSRRIEEANTIYRGTLLEGLDLKNAEAFEEWLRDHREAYQRWALACLDALMNAANIRRDSEALAHHALRALAINPLRESPYRELMLALARKGNFNQALQVYKECVDMSEREFGILPSAATMAAYERIVLARAAPHPQLPFHNATFISRTRELAEATARLMAPECRLLTLLGPGGMGKTRLAIELARRNRTLFLHDIGYVALEFRGQPITEDHLLTALAMALGLVVTVNRLWEEIVDYLRPREILLILDNFEQYVSVAGVLRRILEEAPDVKALVTSRERLDVPDEFIYRVAGLAYPNNMEMPHGVSGLDTLADSSSGIDPEAFDSLALFARVAGQLDPTFNMTPVAEAAATICRLVEGSPLAIEMIAPWTLTTSCAAIADQLAANLSPLITYERNFPERHRSLNVVFEHSWELLTPAEKQVFRRLAVIVGDITLPAAEAVAGATESILQSLASKSMIDMPDPGHYTLHSLLRAFAIQKMLEAGEQEEIAARHFAYFSRFVESRLPELRGAGQVQALRQLANVFGDIRAAWLYGMVHAPADRLLPLINGIFDLCTARSWYVVGLEISHAGKEALERRGLSGLMGRLLLREGLMHHHLGNYEQARRCAEEGRIRCQREADAKGIAAALFLSGTIQYDLNQYDEAERLFSESVALSRRLDDWEAIADWHIMAGHIADLRTIFSPAGKKPYKPSRPFFFEHYPPTPEQKKGAEIAILHFQEALRLYEGMGHRYKVAWCRGAPGFSYFRLHQYDVAANCYREAAELFNQLDSISNTTQCLNWLAWVLHWQGEIDEARRNFHRALTLGLSVHVVKRLLDCLQKYSLFLWKTEKSHFIPLAVNYFVARHPNTDGRMRVTAEEWVTNISDFLREDEGQAAVEKALTFGKSQTLSGLIHYLIPNP